VKKFILLHALLAGPVLLAGPALAQEQSSRFDPASIMPADTVLYVEVDAAAAVKNLAQLDLVRVVYTERFKSFFGPLRENIPATVEDLGAPISLWLRGQAAIGVSGVAVRLRNFDGSWDRIRITPGKPMDGRLAHRILTMDFVPSAPPRMLFDLEAVAVVEAGPALRAALNGFLDNPPIEFTQKIVQRGARQILTLKFRPFYEDGIWMAPEFYADITGDRWIIATSEELLAKATATARRTSLADDKQFAAARNRHTSGAPVAFLYGDARRLMGMAKPLLPPVAAQMLEAEGFASIRSFSMGVSIVEGGIRESYGIGLDENPKGFWKLLDALPPGLRSIHKAPKRAVGIVALKFDPALFMTRFDEVVGGLFPGMEKYLRGAWTQELLAGGFKLDTDILPSFGDEAALIVLPPGGMGLPIPDLLFAMELRDTAAFGRVMEAIKPYASRPPVVIKEKKARDGSTGWQMSWPVPTGMPVFEIHAKHLIGSTNPFWLRRTIANWDKPADSLAKDGEVFKKVMRGMNGGDTDGLVALIYADLRAYIPLLLAFAAGTGVLPEEVFETRPMPDLTKLGAELSGMAFSVRRDKHGVAFESFGPAGGVLGVVPWLAMAFESRIEQAVAFPVR